MKLEDREMPNKLVSGKKRKISYNDLNVLTDETLVKMAQEGSSTAEEYLIEKYRTVAKHKTKSFFIVGGDNEDVIQEGMIGIYKAIRDYDCEKDATFKTFAELCITRQIISATKKANRLKHKPLNQYVSLSAEDDELEGGNELSNMLAANSIDEPESIYVIKEIIECITENDKGLFSPLESQVLEEKIKGNSYTNIAKLLGKEPKAIDNALQRIKKKIDDVLD